MSRSRRGWTKSLPPASRVQYNPPLLTSLDDRHRRWPQHNKAQAVLDEQEHEKEDEEEQRGGHAEQAAAAASRSMHASG